MVQQLLVVLLGQQLHQLSNRNGAWCICERSWFRECTNCGGGGKTDSPAKQALVSMTGTFLDTFIVCTITGLVLITTGAWKSGKTGVEATTLAFQSVFGTAGSMILGIAIILFAYSTILGWSYYGEKMCSLFIRRKCS